VPRFTLDPDSPLSYRLPEKIGGILALGRAYIAREQRQPQAQQVVQPPLERVQGLVAALDAAARAFNRARAARNVASQQRQQARDEARPLLIEARDWLALLHRDNLYRLGQWGFETRQSRDKITTRLPYKPADLAANLQAYVAKEQSLPEAERLTRPPLARMAALNDRIQSTEETVRLQQAEREAQRQERDRIAKELLDALRMGLIGLIYQNEGRMDSRFQEWGYDIFMPGPGPGPQEENNA